MPSSSGLLDVEGRRSDAPKSARSLKASRRRGDGVGASASARPARKKSPRILRRAVSATSTVAPTAGAPSAAVAREVSAEETDGGDRDRRRRPRTKDSANEVSAEEADSSDGHRRRRRAKDSANETSRERQSSADVADASRGGRRQRAKERGRGAPRAPSPEPRRPAVAPAASETGSSDGEHSDGLAPQRTLSAPADREHHADDLTEESAESSEEEAGRRRPQRRRHGAPRRGDDDARRGKQRGAALAPVSTAASAASTVATTGMSPETLESRKEQDPRRAPCIDSQQPSDRWRRADHGGEDWSWRGYGGAWDWNGAASRGWHADRRGKPRKKRGSPPMVFTGENVGEVRLHKSRSVTVRQSFVTDMERERRRRERASAMGVLRGLSLCLICFVCCAPAAVILALTMIIVTEQRDTCDVKVLNDRLSDAIDASCAETPVAGTGDRLVVASCDPETIKRNKVPVTQANFHMTGDFEGYTYNGSAVNVLVEMYQCIEDVTPSGEVTHRRGWSQEYHNTDEFRGLDSESFDAACGDGTRNPPWVGVPVAEKAMADRVEIGSITLMKDLIGKFGITDYSLVKYFEAPPGWYNDTEWYLTEKYRAKGRRLSVGHPSAAGAGTAPAVGGAVRFPRPQAAEAIAEEVEDAAPTAAAPLGWLQAAFGADPKPAGWADDDWMDFDVDGAAALVDERLLLEPRHEGRQRGGAALRALSPTPPTEPCTETRYGEADCPWPGSWSPACCRRLRAADEGDLFGAPLRSDFSFRPSLAAASLPRRLQDPVVCTIKKYGTVGCPYPCDCASTTTTTVTPTGTRTTTSSTVTSTSRTPTTTTPTTTSATRTSSTLKRTGTSSTRTGTSTTGTRTTGTTTTTTDLNNIMAIARGKPEIGDVRIKVLGMDLSEQAFTVLGMSLNGTIMPRQAEDTGALCAGEYVIYEVTLGNFSKEQMLRQQEQVTSDVTNLMRAAVFLAAWAALCFCAVPIVWLRRQEPPAPTGGAGPVPLGTPLRPRSGSDSCVCCLMVTCPAIAICAGVLGAIWITTEPTYGMGVLVIFFLSLAGLLVVNWRIRTKRAMIEQRHRLSAARAGADDEDVAPRPSMAE